VPIRARLLIIPGGSTTIVVANSGIGRGRFYSVMPAGRYVVVVTWARRQPVTTWRAVAAIAIAVGVPSGALIFWQAQRSCSGEGRSSSGAR
jgi:hypothetical protein